jgi:hypothetical protein
VSEGALRARAARGKLPTVRHGEQTFGDVDIAAALVQAYALLRQIAQRAREQAHIGGAEGRS